MSGRWIAGSGLLALLIAVPLVSLSAAPAAQTAQVAQFATNTPRPQSTEVSAETTEVAPEDEAMSESEPAASTAVAADSTVGTETLPVVNGITFDPSVCEEYNTGDAISDECLAVMEAFPVPPVVPVEQDKATLSNYEFWKIGPGATTTYSAPNGAASGEIPAGFNFVTAVGFQEGWIQIEGGQWIRESDASYTPPSYFTGVTLPHGLEHEFAWVLDLSQIYVSEYPGGPASQATGRFLKRYELVNIFAEAYDDEGWRWYMIGPNQWVKQTFVAKAINTERPEGVSGRWVSVDLYEQVLIAYEDDTPVFATLIATGIPPTETNEGLFTVWERLEADGMSGATGAPDAYALQRVPWVMYFDGGISLHGTYWHDLFGYRQSHGCVNLTVSDAKWVYNFLEEAAPQDGELVNHVYVYSTGEYGGGVLREQSS